MCNLKVVWVAALLLVLELTFVTRLSQATSAPEPFTAMAARLSTQVDPGVNQDVLVGLLRVLYEKDTASALAELNDRMAADPVKFRNGDSLAHMLGHATYERYRTDPAYAFSSCRVMPGWSCYHGVTEGYVAAHGVPSSTELSTFCKRLDPENSSRIGSGCWHALGHGLAAALGYDRAAALDLCTKIPSDFIRACWDGTFMELISATQMGATNARVTDCTDVAGEVLLACARSLPNALVLTYGERWDTITTACTTLAPSARDECLVGLGGRINGSVAHNIVQAAAICEGLKTPNSACTYGVLAHDITKDSSAHQIQVCGTIGDVSWLGKCYLLVGARLRLDSSDTGAVRGVYTELPLAGQRHCLLGAGLP